MQHAKRTVHLPSRPTTTLSLKGLRQNSLQLARYFLPTVNGVIRERQHLFLEETSVIQPA